MGWQSSFPVINGKDTTASQNKCYFYENLSICFFYDLQPFLYSSQGTLESVTERQVYEDINNSIRRNFWPNLWWWIAKSVSGISVSNFKWLWQTKMVLRHKSHNLTWSTTCLCASPTEGTVRSFYSAHQAEKNHVSVEKLCYLMLWIYKGDE